MSHVAVLAALLLTIAQPAERTDARPFPAEASAPLAQDTTVAGEWWLIMPSLFYTPETELGGGVAVGYYPEGGHGRRPSAVLTSLTVTTRSQIMFAVVPDLYLGDARWHLRGELLAQEFPDLFYGIGPDARVDDEEEFTARTFAADLTLQRETLPELWLGARAVARYDDVVDVEAGGLLDGADVPGAGGGTAVGLGPAVTLDTRDSPFATRRGVYVDASLVGYAGAFGSDDDFTAMAADVRGFLPMGEAVIAARAVARSAGDGAPFLLLPRLGGDRLMRGYRGGRYRDARLAVAQAEARFPIAGRFGGVVFGSIGGVASTWDRLPPPGDLERALGIGLRFRLTDSGINLRADWARGRDSSALYLAFGEAF